MPSRQFKRLPPYQAAVDWNNPITRGMVFAAIPLGNTMVDLVSQRVGTRTGTSPPFQSASATGQNIRFTGGGTGASYLNFGPGLLTADIARGPCTWFFYVFPDNSATAFATRNDGNASAGWEIGLGAGTLAFSKTYGSANFNQRTNESVFTGIRWYSLAVSYDGVSTAGGVNFYIQGVPATVIHIGTGSGTSTSDEIRDLKLGVADYGGGSNGVPAGSYLGNMEVALFFKRILSDVEIMSLHRNRYQVFKTATLPVFKKRDLLPGEIEGVTGTGELGAFGKTVVLDPLTGVQGTGSAGTAEGIESFDNIFKELPGVQAAGEVGTPSSAITKAINGVSGTGRLGAVYPDISIGGMQGMTIDSPVILTPTFSGAVTLDNGVGVAGQVFASRGPGLTPEWIDLAVLLTRREP